MSTHRILLLVAALLGLAGPAWGAGAEEGYFGVANFNRLVGLSAEVANSVGSVYVVVGQHLGVSSDADWQQGSSTGFVAGIRGFTDGGGLDTGWFGTLFGGTMGVYEHTTGGRTNAYQRLGWGVGIGYQWIMGERVKLDFTLGGARLDAVEDNDRILVDKEVIGVGSAGLKFRF